MAPLTRVFVIVSYICSSYLVQYVTATPNRDPYKVLGLQKGCTEDEIRKAYRRQSLKHHPDKPSGSEATFKELNEAYDILSDPEKRQQHDAFVNKPPQRMPAGGAADFSQFFGQSSPFPGTSSTNGDFSSFFRGSDMDLSDILRNMMAGMPDDLPPRKNTPSPIIKDALCSLEDLYKGATKKFRVRFRGGETKIYTVRLKPGWKSGTKVSFSKPEPVTFIIQEKRHPLFIREGNDILYRHSIRENDVVVQLLDGSVWRRTLPQGFRIGERLTVPGKGMPIRGGPERGDFVVEFVR